MEQVTGRDFFISYTGVNEAWARWIAVELERAGYTTVVQAFDFRAGSDFVHEMQQVAASAARTIAVLSPTYFGSHFAESEWRVAFAKDPTGEHGMLVPVRVQPCDPPGLLMTRVFVDLVDVGELEARERLLAAVGPPGPRPTNAPFPGACRQGDPPASTRFPGSGPAVTNLAARNRNFTGRDSVLAQLHDRLKKSDASGSVAVLPVEAVYGLGGVGKTALALEYAHRFGSDYELIWWIAADDPATAATDLARLAARLGIADEVDQVAAVQVLLERLRSRRRWLLIYDNAERPENLAGLVPAGGEGHVLVTSRWTVWSTDARPLRLDVLDRAESVRYLQHRTGSADIARLSELAELVGDLPLALAEIAGYVEQTRIGLAEYLDLLQGRARELFGLSGVNSAGLDFGKAEQRRVATVWSVSLDQIQNLAPAAESLMMLCAFLAPVIPRTLPGALPEVLPEPLGKVVSDPLAYNAALRVLGEFSMVALDPATLVVHQLVQAVIRARLDAAEERAWVERAIALIKACFPHESWDTANWPECERLLPHLMAVAEHGERLAITERDVGWILDRAARYQRACGQYRQALPFARRALANTRAALGPDHPLVAWQHDEVGLTLLNLGNLTGARTEFERALQISESALGPEHPIIGVRRNSLGLALERLGDLAGARTQYERALQISETALGPGDPTVGTWRFNLGLVLRNLGDLAGARMQLERALQISEAALGPDHPHIGNVRGGLGSVLRDLGDLAGARTQLERAVQISEGGLGPDHPDSGSTRGALGYVLHTQGDLGNARTQFERALEIAEVALGSDHFETAALRVGLGGVLQGLGDLVGARAQLERALQIGEVALGSDHPSIGQWRCNLAFVLQGQGDLNGARIQLDRAVQIGETALGPDHPNIGAWRAALGGVLQGLGDLVGARIQLERALQIGEAALGPNHLDIGTWSGGLGTVLLGLGDLAGARTQYERALQISETTLGPDHPNIGAWHAALGGVLQGLGDLAGARIQLERALQVSETALGPDHPDTVGWRGILGGVLQGLGDLAGARMQLERAVQIGETALGPDHPDTVGWRGILGGVLQALGDLAGSRMQLEQALQISETQLDPDNPVG